MERCFVPVWKLGPKWIMYWDPVTETARYEDNGVIHPYRRYAYPLRDLNNDINGAYIVEISPDMLVPKGL